MGGACKFNLLIFNIMDNLAGQVMNKKTKKMRIDLITSFKKKLVNKKLLKRNKETIGMIKYQQELIEIFCPSESENNNIPYQVLLERGFNLMIEQKLNVINKKKCRIFPPNVSFSGRKKTLYANLKETCELLNRDFEHLKEFLYTELGTTG